MDLLEYDDEMTGEIMDAIENLALMTQREFVALRAEMQEFKEDLKLELKAELKAELRAEFKADIRTELRPELLAEFQAALNALKAELHEELYSGFTVLRNKIDGDIASLRHETALGFAGMRSEADEIRQEMRVGFAAVSSILSDHECRTERLEKNTDFT
ncbi:MAG TPA: hypothetical protein VMT99_03120 [Candidatus Paceibacterota bacterium]|nr:hypothetical protein [Candidatus Paceibacterota bacterium]